MNWQQISVWITPFSAVLAMGIDSVFGLNLSGQGLMTDLGIIFQAGSLLQVAILTVWHHVNNATPDPAKTPTNGMANK